MRRFGVCQKERCIAIDKRNEGSREVHLQLR